MQDYAGKEFTKETESLLLHTETSKDRNLGVQYFIIWSEDTTSIEQDNFSNTEINQTAHITFFHVFYLVFTDTSSMIVDDLTIKPVSNFQPKFSIYKEVT